MFDTAARMRALAAEIERAMQLAVAKLGLKHALVADVGHEHGLILSGQGDHAGAIKQLTRALQVARDAVGPQHLRTQSIELSLARELARDDNLRAIGTMERIANATTPAGSEPRNLRWRARAYVAEAKCRSAGAVQAQDAFDTLSAELRTGMPQGGRLSREVQALRNACAPLGSQRASK